MGDADEGSSLTALRSLILAEQASTVESQGQRLDTLENRIFDTQEHTVVVSEVLPDVLRRAGGVDSDLHRALRPEVESAIHRSVREEPNVIAEAIYPIMGPVIRKIVQKMFEGAKTSSLNPYQVEQLFLIHRETGLIIRHQVAPGVASQDADIISGMLDAIRSFVQEAFDAHEFDGLQHMTVGEVNVRIEWSPLVVLAAVVRGIEPASLQPALEETLQKVNAEYEQALERFDGDSEPFDGLAFELQSVLDATKSKVLKTGFIKTHARLLAIAVVTLSLMILVVNLKNSSVWAGAMQALADQPGIVVVEQEHGMGRDSIRGLLDPDAGSVQKVLIANGIDLDDVDLHWEPFISDDPRVKLKRAERILQPPETAFLHVEGRQLYIHGKFSSDWFHEVQSRVNFVDGIDSVIPMKRADPQWRMSQ